jgi:CheY-like chemotaxis protein
VKGKEAAISAASISTAMSVPIRVLLVEDNSADADLTVEMLERGKLLLDIVVVDDGAKAIDYLERRPPYEAAELPDLVLLDLNLPKANGQEVLAAMKQNPNTRRTPVVILTSSDAEQDIAKSYELGANCYVTKPVGIEAFQRIVRTVEHFWFSVVKLP